MAIHQAEYVISTYVNDFVRVIDFGEFSPPKNLHHTIKGSNQLVCVVSDWFLPTSCEGPQAP